MQDEVTVYRLIIASLKSGRVQIFGNSLKRSKFYSGRNQEQIEVREFLLSFGAESFVFKVVV